MLCWCTSRKRDIALIEGSPWCGIELDCAESRVCCSRSLFSSLFQFSSLRGKR